jgi:threonyl-tRNA synthetase
MQRQTRFISTYAKSRLDAFDRLSQTLPILEPIQLKGIKTDQGIPTERIKPATGYDHQTFWHSSSHVLGYALESHFGDRVLLTDGPATKQGFFYDALVFDSSQFLTNRLSEIKSNASVLFEKDRIAQDIHDLMHGEFGRIHFVTAQELMKLEIICGKIAKKNLSTSYLNISKRDALDMFALSPFKLQTIVSLPTNQEITVYKMGDFVDLCKGPHIANTRIIKSFWIDRTSGVQHTPDLPPSLSRINGISFPTTKDMKDHKEYLVEIEKRNHRSIGARQKLFQFHDYSPGAPFMLPHGMKIVNKLKSLLVGMYKRMGFEEVATPLIFDKKLWETSGHWSEYRENMFGVRGCCAQDDQERGLKPMNCPAHCLIYSSQTRSIRDLPLRLAEFSALHRFIKFI